MFLKQQEQHHFGKEIVDTKQNKMEVVLFMLQFYTAHVHFIFGKVSLSSSSRSLRVWSCLVVEYRIRNHLTTLVVA